MPNTYKQLDLIAYTNYTIDTFLSSIAKRQLMTTFNTDDALGFVINKVARKFGQLFNIRFKAYDITSEQWSILVRLIENNGISQTELASISEKDPNNITRLLDQLERKSWVKRTKHPLDRRAYALEVTEAGHQLVSHLIPLDQKLADELLIYLTDDEVLNFKNSLNKINIMLSDKISKS